MIKKGILIVSFLALVSASSWCQERNVIRFKVLDAESNVALPGVTVQDRWTGLGAISDFQGKVTYTFSTFPLHLKVSHLGYFADSVVVKTKSELVDLKAEKGLVIRLHHNPILMDEVVVSASAVQLFKRDPYAIVDYAFRGQEILGIGYRNYNPLKPELFIGSLSGNMNAVMGLAKAREIYTDYTGDIYLISKDSVYLAQNSGQEIQAIPIGHVQFFDRYVRLIKARLSDGLIYLKSSERNLSQVYYYAKYGPVGGAAFYMVGSPGNEIRYAALDESARSQTVNKIQKGYIGPEIRILNDRLSRTMFHRQQADKPVNSALYQFGDTIAIFDLNRGQILYFNQQIELLGELPIQPALGKEFTGRMHRDEVTKRFYLEYQVGVVSSLIEIDPRSGKALGNIPIRKYRHIEKIKVHNNRIYFLYQPDDNNKAKGIFYVRL